MAVTAQMRTDVSQLYVALFQRAPDGEGLGYWVTQLAAGTSLVQVANDMYNVSAARTYYPAFATNAEIVASFYTNTLGREPDAEGAAYWEAQLNAKTPGEVILDMIFAVVSYVAPTEGTPEELAVAAEGTASKALFNNKAAVAEYYGLSNGDVAGATAALAGVTEDPTSVDDAIAAIDGEGVVVSGETFTLTTALDNLTGSAFDDVFTARVVQNANGEQTNQLATGDQIDGGGLADTLNATVQMASALNNGPASAITPETVDVETVNLTALTVDNSDAPGAANEVVTLNAKFMLGLDQVSSVQSDASLVIENLTTLTDSGDYADKRNTESVTIRMDHTGNDAAVDDESNMTVLFDNDYLLSDQTTQSQTFWWVLDQKSNIAGGPPLARIDSDGVSFTIDGVAQSVFINAAAFLALDGTWEAFRDALNDEVALIPALAGFAFSLDYANAQSIVLANGATSYDIPALVLTAPEGVDVTSTGYHHYDDATGSYDVYGELGDEPIQTTVLPVIATIELEKVGRGAEGGALVVGGMSTDMANEWDYSASALKEGVEQFNVTVSGDESQSSSLSGLHSTNNTLVTVNVEFAEDSLADLVIGNHNTVGDIRGALKDVREFTVTTDSSNSLVVGQNTITADVTLHASVTDESVAKYMDLTDNGDNPVNDNADFVYTFGTGNDTLNLNISKANLAASGTTNREDFSFSVVTGSGDDTVTTEIGDGTGVAGDAWFINSELNDNLDIETGIGNDTVNTFGAGSWNVDLGTGNDASYSDNSGKQMLGAVTAFTNGGGTSAFDNVADIVTAVTDTAFNDGRATWVLNTADQVSAGAAARDITDLVSGANNGATVATAISYYKQTVLVSFKGVTASVVVEDYATTDLELNNLIKAAIQADEHLRDLIVAEDGPANTLVVRSLVDGAFAAADFSVSITSNTIAAMTTAEIAAYNAANGTTHTTAGAVNTDVQTDVTAFVARTDYDAALANQVGYAVGDTFGVTAHDLTGAASTAVTASTWIDGTGNDTIVLSTSGLAREVVTLTSDAQKDVIFNVTNATINGLGIEDQVVLYNGTALSSTVAWNFLGGTTAADTITGDAGVNYIFGYAGADILSGEAGNDSINGGADNDTITGGAGADTLTGGAGSNDFVFAAVPSTDTGITIATADLITDFVSGADAIIGMGVNGADAGEYTEGAAQADFATALAVANAVFAAANTQSYYLTSITGGVGLLFINDDNTATADAVIQLTGITSANFAATDILA